MSGDKGELLYEKPTESAEYLRVSQNFSMLLIQLRRFHDFATRIYWSCQKDKSYTDLPFFHISNCKLTSWPTGFGLLARFVDLTRWLEEEHIYNLLFFHRISYFFPVGITSAQST